MSVSMPAALAAGIIFFGLAWPTPSESPVVLLAAAPQYPPVALQAQVEGYVELELQIDKSGMPIHSRMLRTPALLGMAAEAAAIQWRFTPAVEGDPDVRSIVLKLVFRLVSRETPEAAVSAVFTRPYGMEVRGERRAPRRKEGMEYWLKETGEELQR